MSEHVHVRNPHDVPVQIPGYGMLNSGAEATVARSGRLRRAIQHGLVEVAEEHASKQDTGGSKKSRRKSGHSDDDGE